MKNSQAKRNIKLVIIVVSITVVVAFVFWAFLPITMLVNNIFRPTHVKLENTLIRDHKQLEMVAYYLDDIPYDEVCISIEKDKNFRQVTTKSGTIEITSEEICSAIDYLLQKNYIDIIKSSGVILFVKWSSMDADCGIAYTQRKTPPKDHFIINWEKTAVENFYIYEADYNEWRINPEEYDGKAFE